ncbi:MAG: hypothetical protein K5683_03990 [Prevotella sp.]|nr:hypothetical protein [Prevotella sp.]
MKGLIAVLCSIYIVLIILLLLNQKEKEPEVYEARIIVVDEETNKPIKGAEIVLETTDEACPEITLTTNRKGECTFEFSSPDEMMTSAYASKSGYHDAEVEELELAYFLEDDLTIPLKKEDIVNEGRDIGATGNLKVTLLWDNDGVDLDLHVLEPNGFEICYKDGQREDLQTGGQLDIDWIPNNNPGRAIGENIFWENPPRGIYKVWVECYQPEEAPPTDCNVIVYRVNQEPQVFNVRTNGVHDIQQVTTINIE